MVSPVRGLVLIIYFFFVLATWLLCFHQEQSWGLWWQLARCFFTHTSCWARAHQLPTFPPHNVLCQRKWPDLNRCPYTQKDSGVHFGWRCPAPSCLVWEAPFLCLQTLPSHLGVALLKNRPVLLLFKFGLIWLTVSWGNLLRRCKKPITASYWFSCVTINSPF